MRVKSGPLRYNQQMMDISAKLERMLEEVAATEAFSGVVALHREGRLLFGSAHGLADCGWQIHDLIVGDQGQGIGD